MSQPSDPAAAATRIEQADVAVAEAAAEVQHHPVTKALGAASEIADQPPLFALSAIVIATGVLRRDRRLARTGMRMLAAEGLATAVKALIKHRISRTRPHKMLDDGRYEMRRGGPDEGPWNSFPSGHTAGAVAVSRAIVRDYPSRAVSAYGAAAAVAAIQIPRCAHYPTDIAAGAAIGWLSEWVVSRVLGPDQPGVDFPR